MASSTGELRHCIKTRFLIISDTHGMKFPADLKPQESADVVIHCGDLTEHSKLDEFRDIIQVLKDIDAPLKLVIAGNHDFSLDPPVFERKIAEANRLALEPLSDILVKRVFGNHGASRQLLQEANDDGIVFVDEGTHHFHLSNGAILKIYASPYTPSTGGEWAFQYSSTHDFKIEMGTDVVITHGPPHGIMDMTTEKKRIGCPQLFSAVAKARPRLHCFGHVHNSWGAKLVAWRPRLSDRPSHFSDINHERSIVIESLSRLKESKLESGEDKKTRQESIDRCKLRRCYSTSHCTSDKAPIRLGQTLFVNAAVMGDARLTQLPWLVDIELEPHLATGPKGGRSDDEYGVEPGSPHATALPAIDTRHKRKLNTTPTNNEEVGLKRVKRSEKDGSPGEIEASATTRN